MKSHDSSNRNAQSSKSMSMILKGKSLLPVLAIAALGMILLGNIAAASVPPSQPASVPVGLVGQAVNQADPFGIADFNCADLASYGIEKQMNPRAAAILARCEPGKDSQLPPKTTDPRENTSAPTTGNASSPLAIGGTDKDIDLPEGTYPNVTQSTSKSWAHGNVIIVAYEDA